MLAPSVLLKQVADLCTCEGGKALAVAVVRDGLLESTLAWAERVVAGRRNRTISVSLHVGVN